MSSATPDAQPPEFAARWRWLRPRSLAVGFFAGLLNAMVGIGGGIVIVPGLIFVAKLQTRQAIATSLGAIIFLSGFALTIHLLVEGFHHSVPGLVLLLVGGFLGAQGGGIVLNRTPQRVVLMIFSSITLLFSAQLIATTLDLLPVLLAAPQEPPLWGYPLIGVMAGFFSGLLGIGGGGMVILGFALLFQVPVLGGIPLALSTNVVNAASGVLAQWRRGLVQWPQVWRLVPAALVGIGLGTVGAQVLPADVLRIVFAFFFGYMGLRVLLRTLWPSASETATPNSR